jgi:hypothetical protein
MEENTVCYGMVDAEGILLNSVVVVKDDVATLEELKTFHSAADYHLLDPSLYIIRIGEIYWNETHWDLVSNKAS